MTAHARLRVYRTSLAQRKFSIVCLDCNAVLLPKHFEKHSTAAHGFDCKLRCPWCKAYDWPKGAKSLHAEHLIGCSKHYLARNRYRPSSDLPPAEPGSSAASDSTGLRLADLAHSFLQSVSFGIASDLPRHALLPIRSFRCVNSDRSELRLYRDANLNLAASYVLFYTAHRETLQFYHVMIRAPAYASFREAMLREGIACWTSLFSCWCDGGKDAVAWYRQHVHLILMCLKGRFEEVWNRIRTSDRPRSNYPCKKRKLIRDEMHLVNTILYVSHRKSRCNFSFKEDPNAERKDNHFYLARTLPRESLLPLCLLFEGGWEKYLYQTRMQNASTLQILQHPLESANGQWRQRVRDFYDLPRGIVLPVLQNLAPTSEPVFPALHLADGRTLCFRELPELETLDEDEWLRRQAQGGNCFFDVLEDAWWTPRKRIQQEINVAKTYHADEAARLRVEELTTRVEELTAQKAELTARVEELTAQKAELTTRVEELTAHNERLEARAVPRESGDGRRKWDGSQEEDEPNKKKRRTTL